MGVYYQPWDSATHLSICDSRPSHFGWGRIPQAILAISGKPATASTYAAAVHSTPADVAVGSTSAAVSKNDSYSDLWTAKMKMMSNHHNYHHMFSIDVLQTNIKNVEVSYFSLYRTRK